MLRRRVFQATFISLAILSGIALSTCQDGADSSSENENKVQADAGDASDAASDSADADAKAEADADADEANVFISPSGSDQNVGSQASPFKTIPRAQQRVRELLSATSGDIVVYLRGGTYPLSAPLVFGPEDGGSAARRVTYRSFPGESAVVSGGTVLRDWVRNGETDIHYTTSLGAVTINHLYVGDGLTRRPVRARYPLLTASNQYLKVVRYNLQALDGPGCSTTQTPEGGTGHRLYSVDVETPKEIQSADEVHQLIDSTSPPSSTTTLVILDPTQARLRIVGATGIPGTQSMTLFIDPADGAEMGCSGAAGKPPEEDAGPPPPTSFRAYLENSKYFVDSADRWVQKPDHTIIYRTAPGEDPKGANVVAPRLENLVTVAGAPTQPVTNLHFSNLEFRHTTLANPSHYYVGDTRIAATRDDRVAAITIENAQDISIKQCHLSQIGSIGVHIKGGTEGISVEQNLLEDIGADGMVVGKSALKLPLTDASQQTKRVVVADNILQGVCLDYTGNGISWRYVTDGEIRNNLLRFLSYMGIRIGWWGFEQLPLPSANTVIRNNDIENVLRIYNDGGAIYAAGGGTKGVVVQDNYLHDFAYGSPPAGFHYSSRLGIYLDSYTSYMVFTRNLIKNATDGIFIAVYDGLLPSDPEALRARHNSITELHMVSVKNEVLNAPSDFGVWDASDVGNVLEYDQEEHPEIQQAAGITAATKALWATQLQKTYTFPAPP